jgi:3D (Asp-Asp-Asp) domain-containing protein
MTPYPRPRFSHAARAIRARIWQRCRPHLAFLCAITLAFALCVLLAPRAKASEGRWVMAEVTSYCPCALCCGTHDKTTANNTDTDAVPYAFAADRSLPFGSRIYVPPGLGVLDRVRADDRWLIVDDRGGALDTESRRYGVLRLDLRVRDHWWAVRFGRRSLPVFVASPL